MMKYCNACGAEIKDGQKVCTQCGNMLVQANPISEHKEPVHTAKEPIVGKPTSKKSKKKKTNKPVIAVIVLLAILAAAYFLLSNLYNPVKQGEKVASAIAKNDKEALASMLTVDGKSISKDEAAAFLNAVKEYSSLEAYAAEVKSHINTMKNNSLPDQTVPLNDKPVLRILNNGKQFGLFDKYEYSLIKEPITLTGIDDSILTYKLNGKEHKIETSDGNEQSLGNFVSGIYKIKSTKSVDDQKFDGTLFIDTLEDNVAVEQFDVKFLDITLYGNDDLDENDTFIFINGKKYDYEEGKKYGPFDSSKEIEVYAKGEYEGKDFETNTFFSDPSKTHFETIDVTLLFDNNEISDYINKKNEPKERVVIIEKDKKDSNKSEKKSDDTDENDSSDDVTITNASEAFDAAKEFVGGSFDDEEGTVKFPEKNAQGWGFGIFDEDGNPLKSFNITPDGKVIEYNADGDEVDSGYPYK